MNGQCTNCLINILQQKKAIHEHIEQLKKFRQLYSKKNSSDVLELFCFVIKRAGWHITKVYLYFTFEQECFKKNFILMNQKSRQEAKNSIEKDFYKLMNNSNFSYDCRKLSICTNT